MCRASEGSCWGFMEGRLPSRSGSGAEPQAFVFFYPGASDGRRKDEVSLIDHDVTLPCPLSSQQGCWHSQTFPWLKRKSELGWDFSGTLEGSLML